MSNEELKTAITNSFVNLINNTIDNKYSDEYFETLINKIIYGDVVLPGDTSSSDDIFEEIEPDTEI